ncbi:MAG: DNA replication/repair protein RecF [Ruminococcaceae bacterium]|nr:DNA replication/repair protein RecF [Oscillospiraceae bacterium]
MKVNNLKIQNFRNISDISIEFDSETNVICGENAQGKTNIIEALWLFSGAKSFRGTKDNEYIKFGEKKAKIYTEFNMLGVENNAQIVFEDKKTAFLNEKKLSNTSSLAGKFNAVVFSPSDLTLVTDGPDKRRRFLDTAIGQLYPNYIEILRNYTRAVMQRNKIIKDYRYDKTLSVMLEVFETEIVDMGNKITEYRKRYINILNKYVSKIYSGISSGKENVEIFYLSKNEILDNEILKNSRQNDMFTATTSVGPHRDDIVFKINEISARNFGSQGQKRSVALSLKLAGAEVIKEISGEYPICLLDDVMSELDEGRQNYILNHIRNWQSFITCCDTSNIKNLKAGKVINIRNGGVI